MYLTNVRNFLWVALSTSYADEFSVPLRELHLVDHGKPGNDNIRYWLALIRMGVNGDGTEQSEGSLKVLENPALHFPCALVHCPTKTTTAKRTTPWSRVHARLFLRQTYKSVAHKQTLFAALKELARKEREGKL